MLKLGYISVLLGISAHSKDVQCCPKNPESFRFGRKSVFIHVVTCLLGRLTIRFLK